MEAKTSSDPSAHWMEAVWVRVWLWRLLLTMSSVCSMSMARALRMAALRMIFSAT